ncbi:MAG: hypothetical protein HY559_01860 [Gammaproteobacteria bacterium]|nr:hypothetical protein [Gammaproteobacteria bacterium]
MKFKEKYPPREYEAGYDRKIVIKDCGTLELQPNEQVTFVSGSGHEYDVTRKAWGFYATPSLNGRLADFQLRAALVKNRENRFFILLVERGKEDLFQEYVNSEPLTIICWMDTLEHLQVLEKRMTKG